MKKILALALLACMLPTIASAKTTTYLDDSASFVIAKSVKLGLGEDEAHFAPAIGGSYKVEADKHAAAKCSKDADCAADQYCAMGMCKDLCARNTTKKKVKCSGETPVCTADNHDSYCACNDESCGAALSCKKVGSRYSCEPCGAGEKCGCPDGKMSNGAGKCVTCIADADCADNEICTNPKTEAAACTVLTCPTGQYVANHKCNSCAEAITGCQACTSKTNCTTCHVKYQNPANNGGQCILKTCPAAQYLNEEDGNCYPCSNGCTKCTGPTNCQSCQAAYNLISGAYCELKTCAQGTYLSMSDGQCYACPSTCSACSTVMKTGDVSACTACVDDYKLSGTQCVLKSCSEMGYATSCGGDYNAVPANKSGSDGACYSCQQKSCGEMGYSTSCGGDYNANATGKSGRDGTCYSCQQKSCSQMGYRTGCSGNENATYVKSGSDGSCYSCSTKSCSQMGYSTSCGGNYNANYAASGSDGSCYSCSLKSCSAINGSYRTSCGAGYSTSATGVSGSDGACVTCSAISGYCTADSQCAGNQRCSNNSCVAVSCGTCQTASNHTCVAVSGCCTSNSQCSGGLKCVNNSCVKKSCAEQGYRTSCSGNENSNYVTSGSDGSCYTCSLKSCSAINSNYKTSCGSGYSASATGVTGSDGACVTCAKKSSDTCESKGSQYHTYGPQMVCTPTEVYVDGLRCYTCGGSGNSSSGSSCTKGSATSGTYYSGQRFCYFASSAARNAWVSSGGCASHLLCSTVRSSSKAGCSNSVTISSDGYMTSQSNC